MLGFCVLRAGWLQVYTDRGFLMRVLTANKDAADLAAVDAQLTRCLNDMQAALHVRTIEMQEASYVKLAQANAEISAKITELGGPEVTAATAVNLRLCPLHLRKCLCFGCIA